MRTGFWHGDECAERLKPRSFESASSARLKSHPDASCRSRAGDRQADKLGLSRTPGIALKAALCIAVLVFCFASATAQKQQWRQATDAELASLLPARAPVEKEHIETELRTASGIVNSKGRFIAGVVLLTAGYSADGKYSHYLVVQAPLKIGGIAFKPGEYVFGWTRAMGGDTLSIHFHEAATGKLVGTADARRIAGSSRVESLHIWPPSEKPLIQIGRFAVPYELVEE